MTMPGTTIDTVDVLIVGGGPAGLARRLSCDGWEWLASWWSIARPKPAGFHVTPITSASVCATCTGCSAARRTRGATCAAPSERSRSADRDDGHGLAGSGDAESYQPAGLGAVTARAIVLATGCRERPRAARLIAGDRPLGVFTTGTLQQLVHLHHQAVGGARWSSEPSTSVSPRCSRWHAPARTRWRW